MEVSGQIHDPDTLSWKSPGNLWIEGWVCLRAGLEAVAKRKKSLPLPEVSLRLSSEWMDGWMN